MKKIMILFFSLILLTACQNAEGSTTPKNIPTDIVAFLETIKLPKHFSIDFDLTEVQLLDSAKIYKASILEIDENLAVEKLLKGEIVDKKNYAEGPWYEADKGKEKEYLTVYDGGKSLGMDSGVHGGINYSLVKEDAFFQNKLSTVVENSPGPPGNIAQQYGFNLKSDYGSMDNLSFKDYNDALAEIEELLATIGFPKITVAETYSLDLKTMLEHDVLYEKSKSYFGIEEEYIWSKDDEAYLFFFQQVIDGIPLSNKGLYEISGKEINSTPIDIWYSKDGISNITASNLLKVTNSGEEKQLISGAEALKPIIDSYSEILLENETRIFSMELNYVAILQKDDSYELIPAWIFGIAETSDWPDGSTGESVTLDSYSYYVMNAITGEKIERASDLK
ncbi:hypothetical protein [Bacillus niameyensis]|uniref:hypothetical protein n=1 Tax=Bacillus niameyensis TaxID=1522308 RepID=UPI000781D97D|nr:hypothetical protein [Bacillus niameyensis]